MDVNGYFTVVTGGHYCGFHGIVPKNGSDEHKSGMTAGNSVKPSKYRQIVAG